MVALETSGGTAASTTVYHFLSYGEGEGRSNAQNSAIVTPFEKKRRDGRDQIKIGTLHVSVDGSYGEGERRSNMQNSAVVNPFEQASVKQQSGILVRRRSVGRARVSSGVGVHSWPVRVVRGKRFLLQYSERREEMAKPRLVACCVLTVLMLVMVTGYPIRSPDGKFWCNCSDYNLGGSALAHYDNCDAKCQPTTVVLETSGATAASTSVFHFLRKKITDLRDQIKVGALCVGSVDGSYDEAEWTSDMQNSAIVKSLEHASCRTSIERREEMAVIMKGNPTCSPAGSFWRVMLQHLQLTFSKAGKQDFASSYFRLINKCKNVVVGGRHNDSFCPKSPRKNALNQSLL